MLTAGPAPTEPPVTGTASPVARAIRTPMATFPPTASSMPTITPTPRIATVTPPPHAEMHTSTPAATRRPTAQPVPTAAPRGRSVVYFASGSGPPAAVAVDSGVKGQSRSDRIYARLNALRATVVDGPPGYRNLIPGTGAALIEVTDWGNGLVTLGYAAGKDWGLDPEEARLAIQQIVWTATEEPGVERILILQNREGPARIGGVVLGSELGRESVP